MVASPATFSITCLRDRGQAAERLAAIAERTSGGRLTEEMARVDAILEQVRSHGDQALLALTEKFDGVRPDPLRIPPERLAEAWASCPAPLQQALELATGGSWPFTNTSGPRIWPSPDPMGNGSAGAGGRWSGRGFMCLVAGPRTRARC